MHGFNLECKVIVITGAGSGIGKAIAKCFAGCGAEVRVLDIESRAIAETVEEITRSGGKAKPHQCDVSQCQSVERTFSSIAAEGPIDVLVTSAGLAHVGTIGSTTIADFERVFNVNVRGAYLCMKAAIKTMVKRGGGTILNMASVAGSVGIPDRFAYSMTKGAVRAMTLSVATDYLHKNIRCNCISPARVHTPFVDGFLRKNYPGKEAEMMKVLSSAQPVGRMATPEEIAGLALYLCAGNTSFLTGLDIPFDGGFLNLRC